MKFVFQENKNHGISDILVITLHVGMFSELNFVSLLKTSFIVSFSKNILVCLSFRIRTNSLCPRIHPNVDALLRFSRVHFFLNRGCDGCE